MSGSTSGSDTGGTKKSPRSRKKRNRGQKLNLGSFLTSNLEPTEEAVDPNDKASKACSNRGRGATELVSPVVDLTSTSAERASLVMGDASTASEAAAKAAAESIFRAESIADGKAASENIVATAATSAPKLSEVVRAASSIAPKPKGMTIRPPLSSDKNKKEKFQESPTARVVAGSSYAQQVSGSSNKTPLIVIKGSYVTPRQPPADLGKSRPKSDAGLQGLFDARWQDERYGMYFEHLRGCTQSAYLEALSAVLPLENIFSFGLVGRGTVEVFTTTIQTATKLMLEGIDVGGKHLQPFPLTVKPTRVVLSRVPTLAKNEDLLAFLVRFGKVHGKMRTIPLKLGDKGLGRGILSSSREAFITLNQGCELPQGFFLEIAGSRDWIEVSTEAKCYACHQVGHFAVQCPKRARKVAESTAAGNPASAEVSNAVSSPGAAPTLMEHSDNKMPEEKPRETTTMPAINGATSKREEATSSDEEHIILDSTNRMKRKTKQRPDQEAMPPPPKKTSSKRKLSREETASISSKALSVASEDAIDLHTESEMVSAGEIAGPAQSGYESCGSSLSIGSRFEVASEVEAVPREKLRSILESLHYKKSADRILTILRKELGDPARILPQLKILMREAKGRRKYNEASRCERLFDKVSAILEESLLDRTLHQ